MYVVSIYFNLSYYIYVSIEDQTLEQRFDVQMIYFVTIILKR